MRRFISLFQVEGLPARQVFAGGMLFALLPPIPFVCVALVQNLSRLLHWPWTAFGAFLFGSAGAGRVEGAGVVLYALGGLLLETVALRNLAKTFWQFKRISLASALLSLCSVLMFLFALGWMFASIGFAVIGVEEFTGLRFMP